MGIVSYQAAYVGRAADGAVVVDFVGVHRHAVIALAASAFYLAGVLTNESAGVVAAGDFCAVFVNERREADIAGVFTDESAGVVSALYSAAVGQFRTAGDGAGVFSDEAAGNSVAGDCSCVCQSGVGYIAAVRAEKPACGLIAFSDDFIGVG